MVYGMRRWSVWRSTIDREAINAYGRQSGEVHSIRRQHHQLSSITQHRSCRRHPPQHHPSMTIDIRRWQQLLPTPHVRGGTSTCPTIQHTLAAAHFQQLHSYLASVRCRMCLGYDCALWHEHRFGCVQVGSGYQWMTRDGLGLVDICRTRSQQHSHGLLGRRGSVAMTGRHKGGSKGASRHPQQLCHGGFRQGLPLRLRQAIQSRVCRRRSALDRHTSLHNW